MSSPFIDDANKLKTNLGMPFMINLPAGEYLCDRVKLTFQWKDKNETKGGLK